MDLQYVEQFDQNDVLVITVIGKVVVFQSCQDIVGMFPLQKLGEGMVEHVSYFLFTLKSPHFVLLKYKCQNFGMKFGKCPYE